MRRSEMELRQMLDFTPQLSLCNGSDRERLYCKSRRARLPGMSWMSGGREALALKFHPDDLGPVRFVLGACCIQWLCSRIRGAVPQM